MEAEDVGSVGRFNIEQMDPGVAVEMGATLVSQEEQC